MMTVESRKKPRAIPEWAFLLFFIVWALFISFEYWGFGDTSYVKIHDNGNANVAVRTALAVDARQNESGNWYADLWAGTDSNAQAGNMGLLDLLFFVFPGWLAYGAVMFLQRFVAGYFTHKLLTKHLGVNPWLALFPAMFYSLWSQYAFGGKVEGFLLYDALGLPAVALILYLVGELTKGGSSRRNLALTFLVGFFFSSASEYKFIIFFFPLLLLWLLFAYPRNGRSALLFFAVFCLGWISLEIFELSAAFSIARISQRVLEPSACTEMGQFLATMYRRLPRYLFGSFNFLGFGLGALGLLFTGQSKPHRTNLVIFVLLVVYSLSSVLLPAVICSPWLPFGFFKGFDYTRFYLYIPFLISILAGTGSQVLYQNVESAKAVSPKLKRIFLPALASALILVVAGQAITVKASTLHDRQLGENYANLYENPYLEYLATYAGEYDPLYRAVTIFSDGSPIQPQPAFLWPYGLNTLDGYSGLYTLRFSEYWQAVIDPMMQRYPECRTGIILMQGGSRVSLNAQCDVGKNVEISNVTDLFDLDLLSLGGARYFVSSDELTSPLLPALDISDIHCTGEIPGCTPRYLYENPSAFPLFFTVGDVLLLGSDNRVLDYLKVMSANQLRSTVVVNVNDVCSLPMEQVATSETELALDHYSSDQLAFSFSSEQAKVLVVTWNYVPAWKATIDGVDVPIFPAYHTFMGVFVPAGQHQVELRYDPIYTLEGISDRLFSR